VRGRVLSSAAVVAALLLSGCDRPSRDAAAAAAAVAGGDQGSEPVPAEVEQWVQSVRQECLDADGRWGGIEDYLLPADFNGDSRTDYVLMRQGMVCTTAEGGSLEGLLWGNPGPANDFLVSRPDGGHEVFAGFRVPEFDRRSLTTRDGRTIVTLDGVWLVPGGEIHRVVWGWNGQRMAVLERQNAAGLSVDEEGYPVGATLAAGAAGELPFQEGEYRPFILDPELTAGWSITRSMVRYSGSVDEIACQIASQDRSGTSVRLTLRCQECFLDECDSRFDPPYSIHIQAESPTVIRVTQAPHHSVIGDGRYQRSGPPWQD